MPRPYTLPHDFSERFLTPALVIAMASAILASPSTLIADDGNDRYIVVFREGLSEAKRDSIIQEVGGSRIKALPSVSGSVARLERTAVAKVDNHRDVRWIEPDSRVQSSSLAVERLPWGIDRVQADEVWDDTRGEGIQIGIIDTGIDLNHPDLAGNIKGGFNAIQRSRSADDDNGHGTHIAGIAAASDNSLGVVGVAPRAELFAIKVLGADGSGYMSDVIEGILWAKDQELDIINLSLGTSRPSRALRDAVVQAKNAGLVIVAASGNSGANTMLYPARYPEVISVGATDQDNRKAKFSSYGATLDVVSPGVSIPSTYRGGYAIMSGTSMAAPHAAGAAALLMASPVGARDADGDGNWDPDEVKDRLQRTATDLGSRNFDVRFGWGLVNLDAAL